MTPTLQETIRQCAEEIYKRTEVWHKDIPAVQEILTKHFEPVVESHKIDLQFAHSAKVSAELDRDEARKERNQLRADNKRLAERLEQAIKPHRQCADELLAVQVDNKRLREALKTAIDTVMRASKDFKTGELLSWYAIARDALNPKETKQ